MIQQNLQTFIDTELNHKQKEAALQQDGCTLIIAGAGSGKTRVITTRIADLMVNKNVPADLIVALTFTNKAAKEMQERIKLFLAHRSQLPFIGTFHSYCLKLLKTNPHILNMPFFSIIDTDDQEKMIQSLIQRNNLSKQITAKQVMYQISHLKNQAITQAEHNRFFTQNALLREIFHAYEDEKKISKCLDFDDLLHYGFKLFKDEQFKKQFQQNVRHILIDEYQDTNIIQHALLKAMSLHKHTFSIDSLCVVGDEDQSIYSWRGATVENMVNFKQDFPQSTIIKLEQNYRSVQPILDIANYVIKHNKQRNPKKLWSEKTGTNRIASLTCSSEYQEGDAIAQLCKIMQGAQKKLSSCAVLYRTHFQSRAIEEALIQNAIPYKIIGGIQFYERKEIKDLLAYLRLIINPFDRPSLFRILNTPTRGLGNACEILLYERWNHEPFLTFLQIITKVIKEELVKGKKAEALEQFAALFIGLDATITPKKTLEEMLVRSAYISFIKESCEAQEAEARIDNIKEFIRAIDHFQTEQKGSLDQFLQEVALMQEKAQKQEDQDAVLMMTYHAAKGLEFDTVVLVGLEEGLLPSSRSLCDTAAIEEERRLFYVGITRAKERILLSKSRYRYTYGKMNTQSISRFLKEIPEYLITAYDIGNIPLHTIKQWFAQWLETDYNQERVILTFSTPATPCLNNKEKLDLNNTKKWAINQPVKHATFGIGIVTKIEEQDQTTYLTITFKRAIKKIVATFVQTI